jgi:hypothetical protein
MQYVRLYSGKGGESHFAEVELVLNEIDYRPPAPLLFVSTPSNLVSSSSSDCLSAGPVRAFIHLSGSS